MLRMFGVNYERMFVEEYAKGYPHFRNGIADIENGKHKRALAHFNEALYHYRCALNHAKHLPEQDRKKISKEIGNCFYNKAQIYLENEFFVSAAVCFRKSSETCDTAKSTLAYHMKTGYIYQSEKSEENRLKIKYHASIVLQDDKELNKIANENPDLFNRLLAKEDNQEEVLGMLTRETRKKLENDFGVELTNYKDTGTLERFRMK